MYKIIFLIACFWGFAQQAWTQKETPAVPGPAITAPVDTAASDSVMVTIILKYQQEKSFVELRRKLESQGFWEVFPPQNARVVSWNIAVGLGHIVTLQLPADGVRTLYLAIANGAWGVFNSEVFITYEYLPIWEDYMEKRAEAREDRN